MVSHNSKMIKQYRRTNQFNGKRTAQITIWKNKAQHLIWPPITSKVKGEEEGIGTRAFYHFMGSKGW